ncbi:M43 family zinc metalloprotease [Fulvivirgaceae bacterium BMA10]|uniref:M43 family zinc metalloprotease n=1 Tax=Splendidivirga corallicola TaxID=3051826 RepID=A0ABT8KMK5_9BACT|nr:M43 family zinc metalloprotease [Fulvivirgaceae bacterium BMA10]
MTNLVTRASVVICLLLFFQGHTMAQHDNPCRADEVNLRMDKLRNSRKAVVPRVQMQKTSDTNATLATTQYVIPTVVHVFGTNFAGWPVNDNIIQTALEEVNKDFKGLNTDFNDVVPAFAPLRATMDLEFRLATIDPNGNPTTGIIYHPDVGCGLGNAAFDTRISDHAWDNYKYCNVYISLDLHCEGSFNSGVAWLPDVSMSNANTARVVYNGRYLWGNDLDSEFQATLTHEFGHWLGLHHTFRGNCSDTDFAFGGGSERPDAASWDDTPATLSNTSGCSNAERCAGAGQVNVSNYMDYSDCRRMYTAGQVQVMTWHLENHPGRQVLWQESNLIATGTSDGPADTEPPTAPTGLTATVLKSYGMVLNWTASTDNVGVVGYNIYDGATKIASSNTNSVILSELSANTSFSPPRRGGPPKYRGEGRPCGRK